MMGLVNLWILSGSRSLEDFRIALDKLKEKGIKFLNHEIASIDLSDKSVTTATTGDRTNNNNKLVYDYLIIALGAELAPEQINGFNANDCCFNVYDAQQIPNLLEKNTQYLNGCKIRSNLSHTVEPVHTILYYVNAIARKNLIWWEL